MRALSSLDDSRSGPIARRWNQGRGWWLGALSVVLFAAGLFNSPPWKGDSRDRRVEINAEPIRVAASLLRQGRFSDPFATPTGPTAHVAPALPLLQYLILRFVSDGRAGWLAVRFLPAFAVSMQLALLPWLAPRLGYPTSVGVLASVLGLLFKPGLDEQWESHLAGLAALLLTSAACVCLKRAYSPGWSLAVGVFAGIAAYLNPVLGAVYLAWVAWIGRPLGHLSRQVLPLWLAPLLMITPWTVRNLVVLGGLFPVRDDLGLELYVSYNDCAPYGFLASIRNSCIQRFHPNSSVEEALAVRAMGEYQYNRDRFRTAVQWVRFHPGKATALTAQRIWYFWFPSDDGLQGYRRERARMLSRHILTLASFVGLYLCLKRRRTASGAFLLAWVALFPLVYYLAQFDYRYRYPIFWTTWLLAADSILPLARFRFGRLDRRRRPAAV